MGVSKRKNAPKASTGHRKQKASKASFRATTTSIPHPRPSPKHPWPSPKRPEHSLEHPQPKEPPYDYAAKRYHDMSRFLKRVYADKACAATVKHIKFSRSLDLLEYSGLLLDGSARGTPAFKTVVANFNNSILQLLRSTENPDGYDSPRDIPLPKVLRLYAALFAVCENIETITLPREWMNIFPVYENFAEVERPRTFYVKDGRAWVMFGSLTPCVMEPGKRREDEEGRKKTVGERPEGPREVGWPKVIIYVRKKDERQSTDSI